LASKSQCTSPTVNSAWLAALPQGWLLQGFLEKGDQEVAFFYAANFLMTTLLIDNLPAMNIAMGACLRSL
jgi:hypothetical protein